MIILAIVVAIAIALLWIYMKKGLEEVFNEVDNEEPINKIFSKNENNE